MVAVAFGTQTGGSVIRPASFCGDVGYKPSYGLISRGGMKFAAESRDTIGLFAREVNDIDLVMSVLTRRERVRPHDAAPKIGLCRTHLWDGAGPDTIAALEDSVRRLSDTGACIVDTHTPPAFADLQDARVVVNPVERSRALSHEWNTRRELISEGLRRQIETGLSIPYPRYVQALERMKACRDLLPQLFGENDILIAPCVVGEAPKGLETTGDTRFQEFWTALHVPTITLPTHKGANGLPVGIQLVGRIFDDERLIAVARWAFQTLGRAA
jgi:amidase